jgi:hypothetical protein
MKSNSAALSAMRSIESALANEIQPVPKGWFTTSEYAETQGIGGRWARERISEGLRLKVLESKSWRFKGGTRAIYRVKNSKSTQ